MSLASLKREDILGERAGEVLQDTARQPLAEASSLLDGDDDRGNYCPQGNYDDHGQDEPTWKPVSSNLS